MRKILLLIPFLFLAFVLHAQVSTFDARFAEAYQLTYENELSRAQEVWVGLANEYPDNGNVNYKAGRAYLGSFSEKTKSLPYLERAVNLGFNPDFNPLSPTEKKAPVESIFYLGKAQQLNYQLEDAIESYKSFIDQATSKHHLIEEAQRGIETSQNAISLMSDPVDFEIISIGPVVNSPYPDFSPVISVDENALFFTSRRLRIDSSNSDVIEATTGEFFEDIYVSYKNRKGEWQEPELLNINSGNHSATMNVSADGQTLFIYKDDDGNGNIYQSKLVGETWSEPEIMPEVINSGYWETHLAISADENVIYFVSNRKGGNGGRDIYRIVKLPNGEWSKALNLGPEINTPLEEDAVFISPDGNTLYFSSQGHNSMGGFDVFYTTKDDNNNWTVPENIGYPINTVDDDIFFVTSADGRRAYYSSVKESGEGEKDLYMINLPEPERDINLALLKGFVTPTNGEKIPESTVIYITSDETGETRTYTPRQRDGVFVAILPPCFEYTIDYRVEGRSIHSEVITVDCESSYREINKEIMLNPVDVDLSKVETLAAKAETKLDNEAVSESVSETEIQSELKSETDNSGDISAKNLTVNQQKEEVGDSLRVTTTDGKNTYTSTTARGSVKYDKFYDYNEKNVNLDESRFNLFINDVAELVRQKGKAEIDITGSASKVPTKTYKTNDNLATLRAKEAKEKFIRALESKGIDLSKVTFNESKALVQGPAYKYDATKGREKYGKYQFIEIIVR